MKDYQKKLKIFKKAQKEGWAIGKFNFSTFEQLQGILAAAKKLRSPVILETSEGESQFFGIEKAVAMKKAFCEKYKIPVFLNLDHGKSLEYIKKAINSGYDYIHFDSSGLKLKENIKKTRKVVGFAHKKGIWVEGELGCIRETSEVHRGKFKIKKEDLTKPEEVEKFVKETGADSLAIAIGNIHGIFTEMPERLDFKRLKEIRKKSNVFLVLHGGSGISPHEIKKAIKLGITKINVSTELRVAWRKSLEKSLRAKPKEVKPYKILPQVIEAVQKVVEEKIKLFGSVNKI